MNVGFAIANVAQVEAAVFNGGAVSESKLNDVLNSEVLVSSGAYSMAHFINRVSSCLQWVGEKRIEEFKGVTSSNLQFLKDKYVAGERWGQEDFEVEPFEVEKIAMDAWTKDDEHIFLVQWAGWPSAYNSWGDEAAILAQRLKLRQGVGIYFGAILDYHNNYFTTISIYLVDPLVPSGCTLKHFKLTHLILTC